ncbi:MAG: hypothetical protein HKM93_12620 [Desulfobacteraceae bacterium]|nr:hypothetical protein [Desulfobacteraceae bacterium]
MSSIIYRAPDSTGIGLFGDDHEPIRLRKSLGSVEQLLNVLQTKMVYPHPDPVLYHMLSVDSTSYDLQSRQQSLLMFEGFDLQSHDPHAEAPDFDALVDLVAEQPARLVPGCKGQPQFQSEYRIQSRKGFSRLIRLLIASFDLSPLAIHTLIRSALVETIARRRQSGAVSASDADIIASFDDLFEATRTGARVKKLRRPKFRPMPKLPNARKQLWQCLNETVIRIPDDYNRDGVCCLFRLLDAALLSRLATDPTMAEELNRVLDTMWLPAQRPHPVNWRTLYATEKVLNVYGWAGAAGLTYLQREIFFPAVTADISRKGMMTADSVVPGRTDPMFLRYLVTPIIAHGRWAMQSGVTEKNAHPLMDAHRQRALVLNGQFDSRVEARLRTFLESVGGYRLRSNNSAEYAAFLWGHFYDQLHGEQRRSDLIREQVKKDMADIAIGSQSIDFNVYHRVIGRTAAELDRMAFIAAARQIVRDGGQIAVVGISLVSSRRLYVASHNRPVFIVRRLDNDDFMVVSDINAALGLFPQVLVERTINALEKLKERRAAAVAQMEGEGGDREILHSCASAFDKEREKLLKSFAVEVHALDGEEIFALIETGLESGTVSRAVSISDFSGHALPELEPFKTHLNPVTVRKDVDKSFHESHLREVPDRFRYILNNYNPDTTGASPTIDLKIRTLRRRFNRRLEGLQRLILIGAGSAFNMATIASHLLRDLMPEIAIDVMCPGDIENPKREFQSQQDLVIMLSWSSTTAEMVQLAQQLYANNILMIGITEKRYADMALTVEKSGGVMSIYSGEEVTIAGVKSTLCMLLCVNLLGAWICTRKGLVACFEKVFKYVNDLADRIQQLNDDADVIAFSKQTSADMAKADAVVVVGDSAAAGTGNDAALKLEESGWYAVGKWYSYDDILNSDPGRWSAGRFVLVHATCRAHIDAAVAVMQKFAAAGVDFVAITCPNRNRKMIDQLCGKRCLILPWADDRSQPYIDLAFYYRLALDFSIACGHGPGVVPRNRAKSSTVTRSRPKVLKSPTAELKQLSAVSPIRPAANTSEAKQAGIPWEDALYEPVPVKTLEEFRRLAKNLCADDPLTAMGVYAQADLRQLGFLLFDPRSKINDVTMVSLNAEAYGVVKDVVTIWRRLINLPIRVLSAGEWPHHITDDTIVLVAATATTDCKQGRMALPSVDNNHKLAWLGPTPPSWFDDRMTTAGRFILPSVDGQCPAARLYVGLNLIIAKAWSNQAPRKAAIAQRHISDATEAITAIMDDADLLSRLRKIASANVRYRTAFFISPFASSGRVWEDQFDGSGRLTLVHHVPGHSNHGPIVTVDSTAIDKYVALEKRDGLTARYGSAAVGRWEAHYLDGRSIDDFLARPPEKLPMRTQVPFYADNKWYLPELQPEYDTRRDNLIILDMTGERSLPLMLDELALLGSRVPRLIVITQEERIHEIGEKILYAFPINNLLVLRSPRHSPIADMHLPIVLNAVGVAMAAVWQAPPLESPSH